MLYGRSRYSVSWKSYPLRVEGWLNVCDRDVPMTHRNRDRVRAEGLPLLSWQPCFCVLMQDEKTLAAYRSEDMAVDGRAVWLDKNSVVAACSAWNQSRDDARRRRSKSLKTVSRRRLLDTAASGTSPEPAGPVVAGGSAPPYRRGSAAGGEKFFPLHRSGSTPLVVAARSAAGDMQSPPGESSKKPPPSPSASQGTNGVNRNADFVRGLRAFSKGSMRRMEIIHFDDVGEAATPAAGKNVAKNASLGMCNRSVKRAAVKEPDKEAVVVPPDRKLVTRISGGSKKVDSVGGDHTRRLSVRHVGTEQSDDGSTRARSHPQDVSSAVFHSDHQVSSPRSLLKTSRTFRDAGRLTVKRSAESHNTVNHKDIATANVSDLKANQTYGDVITSAENNPGRVPKSAVLEDDSRYSSANCLKGEVEKSSSCGAVMSKDVAPCGSCPKETVDPGSTKRRWRGGVRESILHGSRALKQSLTRTGSAAKEVIQTDDGSPVAHKKSPPDGSLHPARKKSQSPATMAVKTRSVLTRSRSAERPVTSARSSVTRSRSSRSRQHQIGDSLFVDLPRVRLDGGSKTFRRQWGYDMSPPPTLLEEEDEEVLMEEDDISETHSLREDLVGKYGALDSSYERAVGVQGSFTASPRSSQTSLTPEPGSSRLSNFFNKYQFRSNPLKRTKSVTKLDRKRYPADMDRRSPVSGLRSSRSHESLLSGQGMVSITELSAGEVVIKPLHSSILGQEYCIQVMSSSGTRYYSCRSSEERDRWIHSLQRALQPNREQSRRIENSLKLWVLEAKGVAAKKRYFCEVHLDDTLYARTSSKTKAQLCFWGEQFEFDSLPAVNTILVKLYREADKKRKKDKSSLVGVVEIRVNTVDGKCMVEKWYPVALEKGSPNKHPPSIRVKCRYQSVDILPIHVYSELLAYITERYGPLCEMLEPMVGVKSKEDIASALVHIMQRQGLAKNLLADLVTMDVLGIDDQRLTFRGNSLATKATECFMRLVGGRYLTETLAEPIRCLLESGVSLEVDPLRVASPALLIKQRDNLRSYVKQIWNAILASSPSFPTELRECFHWIGAQLKSVGQEHQQDNVISSCIFLRFFCPAILSPSLFNLTQEYPGERTVRNLTLVAKTLQTLANFTQFQAKENYMEFLNDFVMKETASMHVFLHKISSPLSSAAMMSRQPWDGYVDLGRHLSVLHSLLGDCLPAMCDAATDKSPVERQLLEHALNSVTAALDEPNVALVYQQPPTPTAAGPPTMPGTNRPPPPPSATYRSLQRNIFRFNDRTTPVDAGVGPYARHHTPPTPVAMVSTPQCEVAAGISQPGTPGGLDRATTLPRNCSYQLLGSAQRPANDLTTSDDYVLMSALRSGGRAPPPPPPPTLNSPTALRGALRGSRQSIGQLSSSGYQSTAAPSLHSQSSADSPIDLDGVLSSPAVNSQQQRRPLYGVHKVYHSPLTAATSATDHPYVNRSLKYSPTSSIGSSISIGDVHAPVPAPVRHMARQSSSSSPSPHRRQRASLLVSGGAISPAVESAVGGARSRRAKAASWRASVDTLASNRWQHCSDSDSSNEPPGADVAAAAVGCAVAAAAARDVRPRHKQRRPQRQHQGESFEEYDDEIRRLRAQMEELQNRMDESKRTFVAIVAEPAAVTSPVSTHATEHPPSVLCQPSPEQISEILTRLSQVEKELRHEQSQVSSALEERDRVIQTQNRRIQELNNANQELKDMLHRFNNRNDAGNSAAKSNENVSDTSDYRSSSC